MSEYYDANKKLKDTALLLAKPKVLEWLAKSPHEAQLDEQALDQESISNEDAEAITEAMQRIERPESMERLEETIDTLATRTKEGASTRGPQTKIIFNAINNMLTIAQLQFLRSRSQR